MLIDKPTIWCTRYSNVIDLSRDGLLPQRTKEVVTKTKDEGDEDSLLLLLTHAEEIVGVVSPKKIKISKNCEDIFKMTEPVWQPHSSDSFEMIPAKVVAGTLANGRQSSEDLRTLI
ncbi:hypothetical protein TNCV_2786601 [Trichonephila clavipes]|nr:hypothetical protein TNCV_2786601 [Trichonephila clavipes]